MSSIRSSATWTPTCTSARRAAASRSAPTRTGRSCSTPTRSPRSRSRRSARPSCHSPSRTSICRWSSALELMPEIVGDESVGVRYAINGVLSGHPRRAAAAGRDPRGPGAVVGGGDLDQGGPGRRQDGGRAHGARRVGDRRLRVQHRPRLPTPEDQDRSGPGQRGLQQDVRDRPSLRAMGVGPAGQALARTTSASRSSRRCSTRPSGWERPSGMSPTHRCWRSSPTASPAARPSGSRAGGARSSTPSTWRCASGPATPTSRRSPSSTSPARARCRRSSASPCARWTWPSGAWSTRRCSPPPAGSRPT